MRQIRSGSPVPRCCRYLATTTTTLRRAWISDRSCFHFSPYRRHLRRRRIRELHPAIYSGRWLPDLLRDLTAPVWLRGIRGDQRPGAHGSPPRAAPVSILRNTRATTSLNSGATARQRHFRGCRNAALVSGTDDPDALVITGHGVTGATVTRQARPTRLAAGLRSIGYDGSVCGSAPLASPSRTDAARCERAGKLGISRPCGRLRPRWRGLAAGGGLADVAVASARRA